MSKIADVKKGEEIGKGRGHKYIWHACIHCGKERWVCIDRGAIHQRCVTCANKGKNTGSRNKSWKGGRRKTNGYVFIRVYPEDFFYPMTNNHNYVAEHRLVMAKSLSRCLHDWEIVHHKNGIRDDNRIENLQLVTDDKHKQITILEMKIKRLQNQNQSLKERLRQIA